MTKCTKCESENLEDQNLSYNANQKNSPRYIYKCKDCGTILYLDKKEK